MVHHNLGFYKYSPVAWRISRQSFLELPERGAWSYVSADSIRSGVDLVRLSLLGSTLSFVLIDVSLALIALVVGFVSALWYVKVTRDENREGTEEDRRNKESQVYDAERANMAAFQLRDLARNMGLDASEHSDLLKKINGQLVDLPSEGVSDGHLVVAEAVSQIVAANKKLQGRLAEAENKIQAQAEEIRSQQSEARTDALTHLANRRAFDDMLAKGVHAFQTAKRPCSLLIFDVDHFKQFNDTHGHQAGDEVLRCVGSTMKRVVKSGDLPCRYGGEEFAVVMRGTSAGEGRIAAERVRKAIEAMRVKFESKTLKVTVSIGLAEILVGDDSAKLIRRADNAVYSAKEAGRNCGYWHNGQQCLPMDDAGVVAQAKHPNQPRTGSPSSAEGPMSDSQTAVVNLGELPDPSVFSNELQRRISESHRFGVPLSVMHLQVKDYPELENEFGSAVGTMLLESVAQFTKSALREMDLLGKLERGRFVVMLPGSSESEAILVGTRLQTAIAGCDIPLGGETFSLQIQWGVATAAADDDSRRIMARARQVMEQSFETDLQSEQSVVVALESGP